MTTLRSEQDASAFSRIFFSWVKPVLAIGVTGKLAQPDMCPLNPAEDTTACAETLAREMEHAKGRPRPLLHALIRAHRRAFAAIVCFGLVHALTSLVAPYFLRDLLAWLRAPDESLPRGLLLAVAIFLAGATSWLAIAHAFFRADKLALRIRAGIVAAIYKKVLRLGPPSQHGSAGRVLNVLSSDLERVVSAPGEIALVIMSLAILTIAVGMLWMMLGVASLAGIVLLAALVPVSKVQARWMHAAATRAAHAGDQRIGLLADILRGIRAVKLGALERALERKVDALRRPELAELRRFSLQSAALSALFLSAPVLVAFAVFGAHVALGGRLDMATAFSAIAIFGLLRPVMLHLPTLIANLIQDRAALLRIEALLAETEVVSRRASVLPPGSISFAAARIGWGDTTVLENVRLDVTPGELIVVSGSVGSGKSTLLDALLGNASSVDATLEMSGSIAYAPQEPFLIAGTVRENVLFGAVYDPARYQAALVASCLEDDIRAMPAGDATEIGERGSNLSGGQRQRLSLARAVYADADVVLLDDPLSGLDAVVSRAVVERAIFGALSEKTRILVTHRRDIARRADQVIAVTAGSVVRGPATTAWSERPLVMEATAPGRSGDPARREPTEMTVVAPLATEEQRASGAVPRAAYRLYLRALFPGWIVGALLLLFVGREVTAIGADYWLSSWSASVRTAGHLFIAGFAALALGTVLFTYARGALGATRGIAAATALHASQLEGLLGSPLAFFETTPLGRLVNRLGRDQRIVDQQLCPALLEWFGTVSLLLSTIIVIVVASPIALVAIVLIGLRYYQIQRYFRASVRDLRRLDAVARSPLLAHVAETLGGLASIRAFGAERRFERAARARLEASQRTMLTQEAVRSWISVRLDLLGSTLAGVAALVAVLGRTAVDPRLAALSITYAMVVTYTLGRAVRTSLDVESNMSAVERVKEYAELPAERWDAGADTPASWPAAGAIELDDVHLRYRPGLPLALRGVSLRIEPGEKIAIVGRTGSGKSSLVAALCRLVELAHGAIRIDGLDIAKVPLAALRGSLTVIPQDPFLFQGTLRENLDPDGLTDDATLWRVLGRVRADDIVRTLPRGLDTEVGGASAVMSAGQRQLLCIARALLRPSPVVVLDEITASVDAAADQLVREVILRELASSTVIMIAHRLDATYAYDRVVVMDAGCIVDIGTPRALLADHTSAFAQLARAHAQTSSS